MRVQSGSGVRTVLACFGRPRRASGHFAGRRCFRHGLLVLAILSVFGVPAVRAQTPGAPASAQQERVQRLSIEEAVALALENNLNLQVSRLSPQIQDLNVAQARTDYTPVFQTNINLIDQTQPPFDILAGNVSQLVGNTGRYNFGLGGLTRFGSNYSIVWNNSRLTTNNINVTANPQLNSAINLSFTQPLLRNFKIDATRQQVAVSENNRVISDVQLQQQIAVTSRNVKNAYYDLMFAIGNLDVQRESLNLAEQSLKDNRARVEIGTMAPIDIVQAEAEVAQREEGVILAEAAIARAEDALRALIYSPAAPDFWSTRPEPTETVTFQPVLVDADAAVRTALTQRTDLEASRKQLETNDVNIRYFENQTLPDVNASLTYNAQAIGGTAIIRSSEPPFDPIGEATRSFSQTLRSTFAGDFPTWTFGLQFNYPIGQANAEAALARVRLQDRQARTQLQAQELQVATQVRELARQVQTNAKRVAATRASRELAERRLEAEEKKFQAGMTTSFLVFQAQRDLNQARNNELQALLDYNRSAVDYETGQVAPLTGTSGIGNTGVSTGSADGTGQGFNGQQTVGQQQRQQ